MTDGDFYVYSLLLLVVIIVVMILNMIFNTVINNEQLKKSKDIEDALYRLIEITKGNTKKNIDINR